MYLSLRKVSYIILAFLFLSACYIPVAISVPSYLAILTFSFICILSTDFQFVITLISQLYHKTPFKFLCFYMLWGFLSLTILLLINKISVLHYVLAIILYIFLYVFVYYITPCYIVQKILSLRSIYKFLIVMLLIISIWGIISYCGSAFNLEPILFLQKIIVNKENGRVDIINLARTKSTFFEPGLYAMFLCVNLPLVYNFTFSKLKLFRGKNLNHIIKKILVLLVLINLLLTCSPIGYVFAVIISLVFFIPKNFNVRKMLQLFLVFVLLLVSIALIASRNRESRIVKRYKYVFENYKKIENLNYVEPSLYTRIVSYTNTFLLFVKSPVWGNGLGETKYLLVRQYPKSPLPLSIENYKNLLEGFSKNKIRYNRNIFCELLSETGIVGALLFYAFLINSMLKLKTNKLNISIVSEFIKSIKYTIATMIFLSFYESSMVELYYYLFICGVGNLIVLEQEKLNRVVQSERVKYEDN